MALGWAVTVYIISENEPLHSKWLPKEISMRPKMGFTFPWEVWLRNGMRSQVEKSIYDFPDDNELGLNMKNCRSVWQMFLSHAPGVSWSRVWAIYVLLRWYNENIYSG